MDLILLARIPSVGLSFGGPLTPMVRRLLWANGLVFGLEILLFKLPSTDGLGWYLPFLRLFGLTPALTLGRGWLWQLVSYMFLHSVESLTHILWNMLMLWMFGCELERHWGSRAFLRYYLITGVGAALTVIAVTPASPAVTIGASGALFGLLLAYGMQFPNRLVYLYFLIPIRVKWMVLFAGIVTLYMVLMAPGGGISHLAHLGGLAFGWVYLKRAWRIHQLAAELRWHWRRRRFRVYRDDESRGAPFH
ncbi:MAG: rhomboid family intramembrane serine protease [Gemmataceae bacterium]|nr:rhomboid family intramembrane serine protease [Gemmataceae bacterium]